VNSRTLDTGESLRVLKLNVPILFSFSQEASGAEKWNFFCEKQAAALVSRRRQPAKAMALARSSHEGIAARMTRT
jgi:hypothetical protein